MMSSHRAVLLGVRFATAAAFAATLLAPCAARAQQLDAERFKPSVTHDGFVNADGSAVRTTADPWEIGGYLNYGRNQLVTESSAGNIRQKVISGRLGGDAFASVTIAKPFAIGLDIPFFVVQTGDAKPSFAGLDDIRLVPKLRILDDVSDGIGLAIAAEVRAPTHAGDFAGGTRAPVFAPRLIVDHRFGALRLGANAGVTLREKTTYFNVVAASELAYAAALEYRFGGIDGKVALGAELLGGVGLVKSSKEELPHEVFPFLKFDPSTEVELVGGAGVGLVAGYGVPVVRVFFGLVYRPTSHDSDKDGVPDEEDKCPNEKETINGFEDDDGCPDEGPAKVIVEQGRIRILETVKFKTGSAELDPQSHSILNQVALTMRANPKIKRIRVEGHTDETGSRDRNMELSQQRAESVRNYLIGRRVSPQRLSAKGYGPDRPLAKGNDDDAHAKNRRVEFIVEQ